MNDKSYRIAKLVIAILALILFYLYIQNGRYVQTNFVIIDKWTGEAERVQVK